MSAAGRPPAASPSSMPIRDREIRTDLVGVDLTQPKRRRCRGRSCVTPRWGRPCSVSSQRLSRLARAGPSVEAAGDEPSPCGARGLSSGVPPLGQIRPKVWTGVFAHCHCVPKGGEVGVAAGTGWRWPRRVPGKSPVAVALLGRVRALLVYAVTLVSSPLGIPAPPHRARCPLGADPSPWSGTTVGKVCTWRGLSQTSAVTAGPWWVGSAGPAAGRRAGRGVLSGRTRHPWWVLGEGGSRSS